MARHAGIRRSAGQRRPKRGTKRAQKGEKPRRRTVYLSYSWDSAAHKEWVSRFAFRLEANGLKVVVDQWHLKLGDSLPRFMETAIGTSDFVLLICTPAYKKRADERVGGVGYEQDLMTAERLVARHYNKFVPVLREATGTRPCRSGSPAIWVWTSGAPNMRRTPSRTWSSICCAHRNWPDEAG